MKKPILTEHVEFIYSNEFDESFQDEQYLISNNAVEFVEIEELKSICRISLTNNKRPTNRIYVEYLYWFDNTSLVELDLKVEIGTFSDTDFENSIKTYFIKNLFCRHCKSVFKGGLAIEPGFFYIGQWQLAKEKLIRLRENNRVKKCPNCSATLTATVVHIFR